MTLPKKILSSFIALAGIGFLLHGGLALADDYGLSKTAERAGLKSEINLPELIGDILGTALSFISVVFFILMLYGGFLWMTARGNSDQESKARDTIFGAVIGLIIVLAAYAITQFVFKSLGPAGSTSPSGSPTSGASQCETKYASAGLTCKAKSTCAKGQTAKQKILDAAAAYTGGSDDVIKFEPSQSDANVVTYFSGLCPGGNDNVCCL